MINTLNYLAQITNCKQENSPKVDPATGQVTGNANCQTSFPEVAANDRALINILQIALMSIAAIALIFIILTALKMVTSRGEPAVMSKARDSIIFATIGLAIVLSAEIIVRYVIGRL